MPVFKINCPECGATLRSPRPMPPGKKVKCPKCDTGFAVPADGAEEEAETARPKPTRAAPAKAPAKPKAAPPPLKTADDDEIGTYAFLDDPHAERPDDEEEDEEGKDKKPDLTFSLDTSIKDPRGPARLIVVRPTNGLMFAGVVGCVIYLIGVCAAVFPLIFSSDWVPPYTVTTMRVKEDEIAPQVERKDLTKEQLAKLEDKETEFLIEHLLIMAGCIVGFVINGLVVFGAVKMQTLESYAWGMTASITAILFGNLLGLIFGIWCLTTLLNQKVKEGFQHEAMERIKRGGADF